MEETNKPRRRHRNLVFLEIICMISAVYFAVCSGLYTREVYAATSCNVKSYGATGNGTTKDTTAIQNAINACAGGGTVIFPSGTYLTAPLFLKSDITLNIESGATILGSETTSDYTVQSGETVATPILALINADNASNITITGSGVINGQGSTWWTTEASDADKRPRLIEIANGSNITVSGVTLENPGAMHLYLKSTSNVTVDNITINSPSTSPNTDGIDPASSHDVTIENSKISDGDDNIAIKAEDAGAPSYNITIKNCTFGSGHGLSIGNDLAGGVYSVTVDNVTFNGTTNGLRIKSTRTTGGDVHDVSYTGVSMTNVQYPIWFSGYYPDIPADGDPAQTVTATTPYYHSITVNNMTASGATAAGYIVGVPEKPFTSITLNDVKITATTGLEVRNATVTVTGGTTMTVSSGSAYIIQSKGSVTTS
jgi:polygalacturonase